MAFLTVASIDVCVASAAASGGNASMANTLVGDFTRAFDGTMRSTVIATKRTWTVVTVQMDAADAATLRAALLANPTCTATGDWLNGDSITVWPKLGTDTPVDTVPFTVQMNFVLEEA